MWVNHKIARLSEEEEWKQWDELQASQLNQEEWIPIGKQQKSEEDGKRQIREYVSNLEYKTIQFFVLWLNLKTSSEISKLRGHVGQATPDIKQLIATSNKFLDFLQTFSNIFNVDKENGLVKLRKKHSQVGFYISTLHPECQCGQASDSTYTCHQCKEMSKDMTPIAVCNILGPVCRLTSSWGVIQMDTEQVFFGKEKVEIDAREIPDLRLLLAIHDVVKFDAKPSKPEQKYLWAASKVKIIHAKKKLKTDVTNTLDPRVLSNPTRRKPHRKVVQVDASKVNVLLQLGDGDTDVGEAGSTEIMNARARSGRHPKIRISKEGCLVFLSVEELEAIEFLCSVMTELGPVHLDDLLTHCQSGPSLLWNPVSEQRVSTFLHAFPSIFHSEGEQVFLSESFQEICFHVYRHIPECSYACNVNNEGNRFRCSGCIIRSPIKPIILINTQGAITTFDHHEGFILSEPYHIHFNDALKNDTCESTYHDLRVGDKVSCAAVSRQDTDDFPWTAKSIEILEQVDNHSGTSRSRKASTMSNISDSVSQLSRGGDTPDALDQIVLKEISTSKRPQVCLDKDDQSVLLLESYDDLDLGQIRSIQHSDDEDIVESNAITFMDNAEVLHSTIISKVDSGEIATALRMFQLQHRRHHISTSGDYKEKNSVMGKYPTDNRVGQFGSARVNVTHISSTIHRPGDNGSTFTTNAVEVPTDISAQVQVASHANGTGVPLQTIHTGVLDRKDKTANMESHTSLSIQPRSANSIISDGKQGSKISEAEDLLYSIQKREQCGQEPFTDPAIISVGRKRLVKGAHSHGDLPCEESVGLNTEAGEEPKILSAPNSSFTTAEKLGGRKHDKQQRIVNQVFEETYRNTVDQKAAENVRYSMSNIEHETIGFAKKRLSTLKQISIQNFTGHFSGASKDVQEYIASSGGLAAVLKTFPHIFRVTGQDVALVQKHTNRGALDTDSSDKKKNVREHINTNKGSERGSGTSCITAKPQGVEYVSKDEYKVLRFAINRLTNSKRIVIQSFTGHFCMASDDIITFIAANGGLAAVLKSFPNIFDINNDGVKLAPNCSRVSFLIYANENAKNRKRAPIILKNARGCIDTINNSGGGIISVQGLGISPIKYDENTSKKEAFAVGDEVVVNAHREQSAIGSFWLADSMTSHASSSGVRNRKLRDHTVTTPSPNEQPIEYLSKLEYEAVLYLKKRISQRETISLQNVHGHINQASHEVKGLLCKGRYKDFCDSFPAIFNVDKQCVSLADGHDTVGYFIFGNVSDCRCDSYNPTVHFSCHECRLLYKEMQPVGFENVQGKVMSVSHSWGVIKVDYCGLIFFGKHVFEGTGDVKSLQYHIKNGDIAEFSAWKGKPGGGYKWAATRVRIVGPGRDSWNNMESAGTTGKTIGNGTTQRKVCIDVKGLASHHDGALLSETNVTETGICSRESEHVTSGNSETSWSEVHSGGNEEFFSVVDKFEESLDQTVKGKDRAREERKSELGVLSDTCVSLVGDSDDPSVELKIVPTGSLVEVMQHSDKGEQPRKVPIGPISLDSNTDQTTEPLYLTSETASTAHLERKIEGITEGSTCPPVGDLRYDNSIKQCNPGAKSGRQVAMYVSLTEYEALLHLIKCLTRKPRIQIKKMHGHVSNLPVNIRRLLAKSKLRDFVLSFPDFFILDKDEVSLKKAYTTIGLCVVNDVNICQCAAPQYDPGENYMCHSCRLLHNSKPPISFQNMVGSVQTVFKGYGTLVADSHIISFGRHVISTPEKEMGDLRDIVSVGDEVVLSATTGKAGDTYSWAATKVHVCKHGKKRHYIPLSFMSAAADADVKSSTSHTESLCSDISGISHDSQEAFPSQISMDFNEVADMTRYDQEQLGKCPKLSQDHGEESTKVHPYSPSLAYDDGHVDTKLKQSENVEYVTLLEFQTLKKVTEWLTQRVIKIHDIPSYLARVSTEEKQILSKGKHVDFLKTFPSLFTIRHDIVELTASHSNVVFAVVAAPDCECENSDYDPEIHFTCHSCRQNYSHMSPVVYHNIDDDSRLKDKVDSTAEHVDIRPVICPNVDVDSRVEENLDTIKQYDNDIKPVTCCSVEDYASPIPDTMSHVQNDDLEMSVVVPSRADDERELLPSSLSMKVEDDLTNATTHISSEVMELQVNGKSPVGTTSEMPDSPVEERDGETDGKNNNRIHNAHGTISELKSTFGVIQFEENLVYFHLEAFKCPHHTTIENMKEVLKVTSKVMFSAKIAEGKKKYPWIATEVICQSSDCRESLQSGTASNLGEQNVEMPEYTTDLEKSMMPENVADGSVNNVQPDPPEANTAGKDRELGTNMDFSSGGEHSNANVTQTIDTGAVVSSDEVSFSPQDASEPSSTAEDNNKVLCEGSYTIYPPSYWDQLRLEDNYKSYFDGECAAQMTQLEVKKAKESRLESTLHHSSIINEDIMEDMLSVHENAHGSLDTSTQFTRDNSDQGVIRIDFENPESAVQHLEEMGPYCGNPNIMKFVRPVDFSLDDRSTCRYLSDVEAKAINYVMERIEKTNTIIIKSMHTGHLSQAPYDTKDFIRGEDKFSLILNTFRSVFMLAWDKLKVQKEYEAVQYSIVSPFKGSEYLVPNVLYGAVCERCEQSRHDTRFVAIYNVNGCRVKCNTAPNTCSTSDHIHIICKRQGVDGTGDLKAQLNCGDTIVCHTTRTTEPITAEWLADKFRKDESRKQKANIHAMQTEKLSKLKNKTDTLAMTELAVNKHLHTCIGVVLQVYTTYLVATTEFDHVICNISELCPEAMANICNLTMVAKVGYNVKITYQPGNPCGSAKEFWILEPERDDAVPLKDSNPRKVTLSASESACHTGLRVCGVVTRICREEGIMTLPNGESVYFPRHCVNCVGASGRLKNLTKHIHIGDWITAQIAQHLGSSDFRWTAIKAWVELGSVRIPPPDAIPIRREKLFANGKVPWPHETVEI